MLLLLILKGIIHRNRRSVDVVLVMGWRQQRQEHCVLTTHVAMDDKHSLDGQMKGRWVV